MATSNLNAYLIAKFGFLAAGLVILGSGAWKAVQSCRPANWPTVSGEVTSCDMTEVRGTQGKGIRYRVDVEYAYTVNGEPFVGETLAVGYKASISKQEAADIVEKLRTAEEVTVRHHPVHADRSVLSHGLHRSLYVRVWFGLVASGISAVLIFDSRLANQRRLAQALVALFVLGLGVYFYILNRHDTTILNNIQAL